MIGFEYFNKVFSLLSSSSKKKILENIFSVHDIWEYYFFYVDSNLFFRIYADGEFYQFVFVFDYSKSSIFFKKIEEHKIICCYIYVFDYLDKDDCANIPFLPFVSILLTSFELDVYRLISVLL